MSINPHPSRAAAKPQASVSSEKTEQAQKLASPAATQAATGPGQVAAPAQGDKFRMFGGGIFKMLPKAPSAPASQASASGAAKMAAHNAELMDLRLVMPAKDRQQPAAGAEAPASSAAKPAALKAGATEFRLRQMAASQDRQPTTAPSSAADSQPISANPAEPLAPGVAVNTPTDAADLDSRLKAGELQPKDFEGLKEGQAADLVMKLATGSFDQRNNLKQLMQDPSFAKPLQNALSEVLMSDDPKVRGQASTLLKSLGEVQGPAAAKVQQTLHDAIDGLPESRRNEMLRGALMGGDTPAVDAAKAYLQASGPKTEAFFKDAASKLDGAQFTELLKGLGDMPQGGKMQKALHDAIDGLPESRRNGLLRDALLGGHSVAKSAVNGYLEASGPKTASFLKDASSKLDGAKLTELFDNLGEKGQAHALKCLAGAPENDVQDVFRKFGEALSTGSHPGIREKFEKALDAVPDKNRAELLGKVIADPSGKEPGDPPNAGQRLAADYFEGKGAEGVKQFLDSVAPRPELPSLDPRDPGSMLSFRERLEDYKQQVAPRLPFENFIKNNIKKDEVLQAVDQRKTEVDGSKVSTAFKKSEDMDDVLGTRRGYLLAVENLNGAELDVHMTSMDTKDLAKKINYLSPNDGLKLPGESMIDYTDSDRLKLIDMVSTRGGPAAKGKLAAGLAEALMAHDPYYDNDRKKGRDQIGALLKSSPNEVLREMKEGDIKTMIKAFIQPPADMARLREMLPDLNGHSAAKFAKCLKMAASEMASKIKAGSWVGDMLKGIKVSAGVEQKDKGKAGLEFSPGPMVDGARNREFNQAETELNTFVLEWNSQLNKMSGNQKAIFKEEMGSEITVG